MNNVFGAEKVRGHNYFVFSDRGDFFCIDKPIYQITVSMSTISYYNETQKRNKSIINETNKQSVDKHPRINTSVLLSKKILSHHSLLTKFIATLTYNFAGSLFIIVHVLCYSS